MRKNPFILSALTLLYPTLGMGVQETREIPTTNASKRTSEPKNSSLLIGANYTRVNLDPDGSSSLNGNMGGLHALYEYQPANAFYAGVEFDWRQGNTHGSSGNDFLTDFKMAERLGHTWNQDKWLATLFTGFGIRILRHHQKLHSQAASFSDKLDYYEFYFPVGFISEYTFSSWFSMGANLTWMPQAFSSVQIRPLGGAYWSLKNTFANFLVEFPFIFNWPECKCLSLVLNPFYERWQDGRSTAVSSTGIPLGLKENTYNFYGVDLNLIYSF